jgi:NAD-dependent deacetylase
MTTERQLDRAAQWLRAATRVMALTGAGISAESGVPTFRGANGLWRRRDPMTLATPEAFAADPRGTQAWYRWRQQLVARCRPNPAHEALVAIERARPGFVLATQNVDGLHREAGTEQLLELHGNLFADRCVACAAPHDGRALALAARVDPNDPSADPEPDRCTSCGDLLRPGVVWFGESLPEGVLERAAEAAAHSELLLVVGTSGVVYPAAGLAAVTKRAGGRVLVVNLEETPHDDLADLTLEGPAGAVLPALIGRAGIE